MRAYRNWSPRGGRFSVRRDVRRQSRRARPGAGWPRQGRTGWCRRCFCGWWGEIANRVSCCMFAVRRFNADLSAWLRQKLARGGLWGPSVALGVIPPLCATLGPVLAGPEGCSRGRWRSGPSKWRHTAAPEGRGQGAPRTCRCIETESRDVNECRLVREHHAPVGALRHPGQDPESVLCGGSGSTTHL